MDGLLCDTDFFFFVYMVVEFLQERLTQETSRPVFSQLPFRFAEVAKILLDV